MPRTFSMRRCRPPCLLVLMLPATALGRTALSDSTDIVTSFQVNDRCAAGCGRYLGYIADEMNLELYSGGVTDQFTFTGGVAKNPAAVGALRTLLQENYGDVHINISDDSIYTGALGAAHFALRDATRGSAVTL